MIKQKNDLPKNREKQHKQVYKGVVLTHASFLHSTRKAVSTF